MHRAFVWKCGALFQGDRGLDVKFMKIGESDDKEIDWYRFRDEYNNYSH